MFIGYDRLPTQTVVSMERIFLMKLYILQL